MSFKQPLTMQHQWIMIATRSLLQLVRLQDWSDWLFDPGKVAVYLLAQNSSSQTFALKKD
jgi:hypothetical protein